MANYEKYQGYIEKGNVDLVDRFDDVMHQIYLDYRNEPEAGINLMIDEVETFINAFNYCNNGDSKYVFNLRDVSKYIKK